jgi:hypothetical protein
MNSFARALYIGRQLIKHMRLSMEDYQDPIYIRHINKYIYVLYEFWEASMPSSHRRMRTKAKGMHVWAGQVYTLA